MRKIILLLFVFAITDASFSQVLKMEHGASFSWTNYSIHANTDYIGALSLDYLEKRHFMLNTKVSFFKREETSTLAYFPDNEMFVRIHYVGLATTARWTRAGARGKFFVGLGPEVDFRRKSEACVKGLLPENGSGKGDFLSRSTVLSVLAECGYFTDIDRWRIELNCAYRNNLTKVNLMTRKGFISHLITCTVGIGYKF